MNVVKQSFTTKKEAKGQMGGFGVSIPGSMTVLQDTSGSALMVRWRFCQETGTLKVSVLIPQNFSTKEFIPIPGPALEKWLCQILLSTDAEQECNLKAKSEVRAIYKVNESD